MNFLTAYNPKWPKRFQQIAAYLGNFIPPGCSVHHVGSTSIPDMPAKDVIDVDIECPRGSMHDLIESLERIGYEHQGDLGIHGREAFRISPDSQANSLPNHHLYACETGTEELKRHILFRDYLAANPDRALWLANEKITADTTAENRDAYIRAKEKAYSMIVSETSTWANKSA